LAYCSALGTCTEAERHVLVLGSGHFGEFNGHFGEFSGHFGEFSGHFGEFSPPTRSSSRAPNDHPRFFRFGKMAGEDIWSGSSIAAFTALNYTQLYAFGGMDALLIYQYLPEVVDIVILSMKTSFGKVSLVTGPTTSTTMTSIPPGYGRIRIVLVLSRRSIIRRYTAVEVVCRGPGIPQGRKWSLSIADYGLWTNGEGNYYLGKPAHACWPRAGIPT